MHADAVDGRGDEALQVEPGLERVGAALGLAEDESEAFNQGYLVLDVLLLLRCKRRRGASRCIRRTCAPRRRFGWRVRGLGPGH